MLLGIRTAPKEDLNSSSAELVYGAPLTVPGDFIANPGEPREPAVFLPQLRARVGGLAPVPTAHHGTERTSLPAMLNNSRFVFLRRDAHRTPLERPYEGQFRVLTSRTKTFQLGIGGRTETVSVDRLKPAHLDIDQPVTVAQPRRRGRPPAQPGLRQPASNTSVPETLAVTSSNTSTPVYTRSGRTICRPARYI